MTVGKMQWDCDYLMHVASPFVIEDPKDENELIKPAKEGTLRALNAAKGWNKKSCSHFFCRSC